VSFDPLAHPICAEPPEYLSHITPWHGHIPFAFAAVSLLRPKVLVELGTHLGDSYCAFLQAVKRLGLDTRCYAVDTWEGEPQAGQYGDEVLKSLRRHHDSRYASFSTLVRSLFDDALPRFEDGSIDLLHIDGLHTYDAVTHDFRTWLPKMSPRGVVLLHDSQVRERDFGVVMLVAELRRDYPVFEFTHCNGLAVVATGSEVPVEFMDSVFADEESQVRLRHLFETLGRYVSHMDELSRCNAAYADLERRYNFIIGSRSWRITRPLRALSRLLRMETAITGAGTSPDEPNRN
jgi:O-antigen biosynthesis protein